jgi:hypothetical protein
MRIPFTFGIPSLDPELIYRRSDLQRTLDSTAQVFTGLYPQGKALPNFLFRTAANENLYPNVASCLYHLSTLSVVCVE